jgi:hypothetical protein
MWYVWNRVSCVPGRVYGWCDVPKQYKTKRAAHMAVRDLTYQSELSMSKITPRTLIRFEYIALPEGMKPRSDTLIRYT